MIDPHTLHMVTAMMAIFPIVAIVFVVMIMIPYWMIWKKAGFSPWLSLLMLVPLVNFMMLYVLAFAEWKVVPVEPGDGDAAARVRCGGASRPEPAGSAAARGGRLRRLFTGSLSSGIGRRPRRTCSRRLPDCAG